ncbi:MAG: EAL domain-containing protein [Pseudomonadota bacterium]
MAFLAWGGARQLWQRYALAVMILVTLLVGGHLLHLQALQEGAKDAETIDLSGRQRMLSQRIAGLSRSLEHPVERLTLEPALLDALQTFEKSHKELLRRSESFPSAKKIYAEGQDEGLDSQVGAFIADVRSAIALASEGSEQSLYINEIEIAAFDSLLVSLDRAVKAFTADTEARLANLERLQNLALWLALGLLALEGLFIFWPAHRSVVSALEAAEERACQLENNNNELKAMTAQLKHSANHDQLTGLANRKKLHDDLEIRLRKRAETGECICVMHVDLDRFKEINDTLGHPVGDAVLVRAAETMRSRFRKEDLVARVGGDEFVIVANIAHHADAHEAARNLAERMIARIKEPMLIDGNKCSVGASVGYVLVDDESGDSDRLIADADIALYEAKRAGKGVAVAFGDGMRNEIEQRYKLISDLERAIDAEEIIPFLQPKVALADGRVEGFEALSRWQHPEQGILPPGQFIQLAEETDLIASIDRATALGGLDALAELRAHGYDIPTLAVNASASSLRNANYVPDLKMAVAIRGLRPADIRIEVVENTLISDENDMALRSLKNLSESGFKIDIDDFGTGYASLSMLSRLQLTGLKIDRDLIDNVQNAKPRQVVEAIVGLAKGMNLEVIAEGVENAKQFSALKAVGCDTAQGFGIGRPMSLEDTLVWLENYASKPGGIATPIIVN